MISPQPRFRMYTSFSTYTSLLGGMLPFRRVKGDICTRLERKIEKQFNVAHAALVPQARVGIYLAVKSSIRTGQKVILSPYTIADVVNMVICAGGVPVFADVDPDTCNIDPAAVQRLIDEETGAVLATHLHGLVSPMGRLASVCRQYGIPLIEDAAQAFGARFDGRRAGTLGDIGICSFGRYKNLISFYGGMVVTRNRNVYDKIRAETTRWPFMNRGQLLKRAAGGFSRDMATLEPLFQTLVFPIFRFGHLHRIGPINRLVETELDLSRKERFPEGYGRRMTPAQARLVLAGLDRVDGDTAVRIRHARLYHEGLHGLKGLRLPPRRDDGSHIYTAFPVQYRPRAALIRHMMARHRDIGIQHLKNCADLPAFRPWQRDCPNARAVADRVILLPTYPRYTEKEVRRNVAQIRAFFL